MILYIPQYKESNHSLDGSHWPFAVALMPIESTVLKSL